MLKSFSYSGDWFLPGSSENLKGTLFYDPVEGARLDVFGSFQLIEFDPQSVGIILGNTSEGQITLLDCYFRTSKRTAQLIESSYMPALILEGAHFQKKDDIQFTDVHFEAFNLFEWINRRSLYSDHDPNDMNNIRIWYERPSDINFTFNRNCEGKITFASRSSHTDNPHQITAKEICTVQLGFGVHKSYEEILTEATIFYQFISLCTFEQSYPTSIFFTSPRLNQSFKDEAIDRSWTKQVRCHFSNAYYKPTFRVRRWHEHIISYFEIAEDFPRVIEGWYKYYRKVEPTFILLLRFFQDKFTITTEKFMDQARAIETFHRRIFNSKVWNDEDYSRLLDKVTSNPALTTEDVQWLKDKLKYGNEVTLRRRLKHLLKEYSNPVLSRFIPEPKLFVEEVVLNRNFYTHFSNETGWKPAEGRKLQELADKIMMLLISCIFSVLEIPSSKYEAGLAAQFFRRMVPPKQS